MKHKLLLLLALTLGLASNVWALDKDANDVYQIGTAQDLLDFAKGVSDGTIATNANAVLTIDINLSEVLVGDVKWTPIGNADHKYTGTFDGQGYSIKNFSYTATGDYNGLFGFIAGSAVVKNFSISGTLTSDGHTKNGVIGGATGTPKISGIHSSLIINVSNCKAHSGGIVGGDDGANTTNMVVEGCEYSGTMTHSGTGDCQAGIMGYTGYSTIRNCIFSGTINGATSRYGGILGYCKQPSFGGVQNCLSVGKIFVSSDSDNKAAIIGTWNGNATSNVKNNYYCLKEGSNITRAIGGNTANCEAPHNITADGLNLANGEVCWMLTGGNGGTPWYQTIGTDTQPVLSSTSKRVYKTISNEYVNIDGPFSIDDANDFIAFAAIINNGGTDLDAELTDNINMNSVDISNFPIGSPTEASKRYTGTFDGQGHKLYNLQLVNTSSPADYSTCIFNTADGVVLKDFWLDNSCAIQGGVGVAIIGCHNAGEATFEGIGNCGSVTGTTNHVGGLIGAAWGKVDEITKTITIKNCWTKGPVSATSAVAGAFCGWFNNANIVIQNCWTIAEVTNPASDSKYIYGNGNGAKFTVTHSYSKNGSQSTFSNTISDGQLTSGELCYLLNESVSGGTKWYQDLPSSTGDTHPYPYDTHGVVYRNGVFCPDTGAPHGTFSYGNADEASTGEHDYNVDDGLCTYCSYPKADFITPEDTYYEIGTPGQLKWFAAYVNVGNPSIKAKLIASPIDLDGVEWTPIGNASTPYTGEFDGQRNAITNFSYTSTGTGGLFGKIDGATIKDFSIGGTLTVNGGTASGVIGWSSGSTISGIHSSLTITTKDGVAVGHVGGVVGSLNQNDNVSGCSFTSDGSITVNANSHNCFGGIAGYMTNNDKIQNCANYAPITYSKIDCYAGGIEGYINSSSAYVQNCLSVGDITYDGTGDPTYGGAIIGYLKAGYNASRFSNDYWLTGSAGQSFGSISDEANEVDEELASGEVAYKLGAAWYQTIGTDTYPTLSNTSEQVLYVGTAGYTTFYDKDNDWELLGDAKAYIGTINGSALHLDEIGDIPHDKAVVIGGTYYNRVSTTATADTDGNALLGSKGTIEGDGVNIYALAKKNDVVGFYPVADGVTIPAGKAYLNLSGSLVREFFTFVFDDDDATGINSPLLTSPEEEGQVYNLAGQRISKLQKGINIINGKKVLK